MMFARITSRSSQGSLVVSPSLTSVRRLRCRWHKAFRRFVSESLPPPAILRGSRNGAERPARLAQRPSFHSASLRLGGYPSRADGWTKSHDALVQWERKVLLVQFLERAVA